MKTNKLMIASLLILVAMGAITVSCKKEQVKSINNKAELVTQNSNDKTGGDEDPIIRVRVKKKNSFVPVDSAYVQTINYLSNVVVNSGYTDRNGEYDRQVVANTYFFKVTLPGSTTPFATDTIHVTQDVQANIFVD